jgi:hypothetical protein
LPFGLKTGFSVWGISLFNYWNINVFYFQFLQFSGKGNDAEELASNYYNFDRYFMVSF